MPRLAIRAARVPRAWCALAFLAFALFAPSCGGGGAAGPTGPSGGGSGTPPVSPSAVVTALAVTPTPLALTVGGSQQLTATPRDASGNAITGRTVTWTSSNAGIATVTGGMVAAAAAGSATITATCDGVTGTATVSVAATPAAVPVNRVVLTPETLSLLIGGTGVVTAATYDVAGAPLTGRTVTWSSSNSGVATVGANGTVKGITAGTATITATSEGKTAIAQVTVNTEGLSLFKDTEGNSTVTLALEQGDGKFFEMNVLDAAGMRVANPAIVAASSDSSVATISSTNLSSSSQPGFTIHTTSKLGKATITLASGGLTYTANVTVITRVDSVLVSPATLTVPQGETRQLTVTLKDAAGNVITGREVQFVSLNGTVASVNGTGVVTGQMPGTTTLEVSRSGRLVKVPVTVTPPTPVATVALTPTSFLLRPGSTQQLAVVTKDAAGTVLTGRAVTYTSSAPTIASVSATGLVTGVALGTATIIATSEGRSATATLSVVPPIATITIAPATALMHPGESIPLTVTTKDAAGNTLTGRQVIVTSNGPQVVRVDTTSGYSANALAAGTVTVTASAEGRTASMTIRVVPPPTVTTVQIVPTTLSLYAGGLTKEVLAIPFDSAGNELQGRTAVFTSANTAVVTATPVSTFSADFKGVAAGTATVTATIEGKSATATVTVQPAQVVGTVRVTPATYSMLVGGATTLGVSQIDTRGVPMETSHPVTWTSSNAGVVSVIGMYLGGEIHGVGAGTAVITATVDGKSSTSTVTVTAPAPPPPPPGGGGGGGGGGSTCAFLYTVGGLAPGQSSTTGTPSFPGKMDVKVTAGLTNTGTASSPRYAYTVTITNRNTQSLTASFALATSQPSAGTDRRTIGANSSSSLSFSGLPPNTTLYLLIEKVTFGTSTTYYCQ